MISYAEQLRQIRDSLTPENWNKGSYFANKNNTLCMCVHGAAQALINPEVQKVLGINSGAAAARGARAAVVAPAAVAHAAGVAARTADASLRASGDGDAAQKAEISKNASNESLLDLWSNRPDWVKKERVFGSISYGFVNLHYLMGMFGITAGFNDSQSTSLEMLKDKLSETAKWAEENEEFLQNN